MADKLRTGQVARKTSETDINVSVVLDGSGNADIDTGIPFMDHMLNLFARHGYFDLTVRADGDLAIDEHHTMEDLGIVMGTALRDAIGDKRGIRRYGSFTLPMDESLVRVAIDLSGRPHLTYNVPTPVDYIGSLNVRLFQEYFQALTNTLALNLHIDLLRGEEVHHIIEGVFKAFARALDAATSYEPREEGVPTTKGMLE